MPYGNTARAYLTLRFSFLSPLFEIKLLHYLLDKLDEVTYFMDHSNRVSDYELKIYGIGQNYSFQ